MSVGRLTYYLVWLSASVLISAYGDKTCPPNQKLELWKQGAVVCSFPEAYLAIYWYESEDRDQSPIVRYENGTKTGSGIDSGEYDIHPNGSLIIANVTSSHEHNFNVLCVITTQDAPVSKAVEVVVIANPTQPYPFIQQCHKERQCYLEVKESGETNCSVRGARPPIHLKWIKRTNGGDQDITFHREIINEGPLFTTISALDFDASEGDSGVSLLVCKAEENTTTLQNFESAMLVEAGNNAGISNLTTVSVEEGDTLRLKCTDDDLLYFIWKKIDNTGQNTIAFGTPFGVQGNSGSITVFADGDLFLDNFTEDDEAVYSCTHGTGNDNDTSVMYIVKIMELQEEQSDDFTELLIMIAIVAGIFIAVMFLIALLICGIKATCKGEPKTKKATSKRKPKTKKEEFEDYSDPDKRYETTQFI